VKTKPFARMGAIVFGVLSGAASAATVVGTYSFEDADLADQAVLTSGQVWDSTTGAYTATPAALTDGNAATYASTYPSAGYSNVTMNLGFGKTQITNGPGADIALFFLSQQSTNDVNVTIGSESNASRLLFSNVYNSVGTQQVAFGVAPTAVYFSVIEINLDDYGFDPNAVMNDVLSVNLVENDPTIAVSLSMAGAINNTVVPVPAAVWLFGSGLVGLAGIARKRA